MRLLKFFFMCAFLLCLMEPCFAEAEGPPPGAFGEGLERRINQRGEWKIRLSTPTPGRKDRCLRCCRNVHLTRADQQGTDRVESRFQDTVIGYALFINLMLFHVCETNYRRCNIMDQ